MAAVEMMDMLRRSGGIDGLGSLLDLDRDPLDDIIDMASKLVR